LPAPFFMESCAANPSNAAVSSSRNRARGPATPGRVGFKLGVCKPGSKFLNACPQQPTRPALEQVVLAHVLRQAVHRPAPAPSPSRPPAHVKFLPQLHSPCRCPFSECWLVTPSRRILRVRARGFSPRPRRPAAPTVRPAIAGGVVSTVCNGGTRGKETHYVEPGVEVSMARGAAWSNQFFSPSEFRRAGGC